MVWDEFWRLKSSSHNYGDVCLRYFQSLKEVLCPSFREFIWDGSRERHLSITGHESGIFFLVPRFSPFSNVFISHTVLQLKWSLKALRIRKKTKNWFINMQTFSIRILPLLIFNLWKLDKKNSFFSNFSLMSLLLIEVMRDRPILSMPCWCQQSFEGPVMQAASR